MDVIDIALGRKTKIINLCDYGINLWQILTLGSGTHYVGQVSGALMEALPEIGQDFLLVNDDGVNYKVAINTGVIARLQSNNLPVQLSFSFTGYHNSIIKADVCCIGNGTSSHVYAVIELIEKPGETAL